MTKITKAKLEAPTRLLSPGVTIEESTELIHEFLSEEIRQEVDRQILAELRYVQLVDEGWFSVRIGYGDHEEDFRPWLAECIIGEYHISLKNVCFKQQEDATMFALRWSSDQ